MPYQANFHPILYILFYVIIYIYIKLLLVTLECLLFLKKVEENNLYRIYRLPSPNFMTCFTLLYCYFICAYVCVYVDNVWSLWTFWIMFTWDMRHVRMQIPFSSSTCSLTIPASHASTAPPSGSSWDTRILAPRCLLLHGHNHKYGAKNTMMTIMFFIHFICHQSSRAGER